MDKPLFRLLRHFALAIACLIAAFAVPPTASATPLTFSNYLSLPSTNAVYASGSNIYAANSTGLFVSSNNGGSWTTYTAANGLGSSNVIAVYAAGNTIYAGCNTASGTGGGLSVSTNNGTNWANYTTAHGLGSNRVYDVFASGSAIYAATWGGGLSVSTNTGSSWTNYTSINNLGKWTPGSIYENVVRGVYAVGSTIYAATYGGGLSISTNNGVTWANYNTTSGLGSNNLSAVYAVGSTIYAATDGGLSVSTNGGSAWTNYTTANGLGSNPVSGVFGEGNTIYAATNGGLSVSMNNGGSWTTYTTANGLGSNTTNDVFADSNYVYVGTRSSLSVAPVPEPSTYALALAGLACGGFSMWRRRVRACRNPSQRDSTTCVCECAQVAGGSFVSPPTHNVRCVYAIMVAYFVVLFAITSETRAETAISVGGAASASSPNSSTFSSVGAAWAGDDGVDRALRTYIVFNMASDLSFLDQASAATLVVSQSSAVLDASRPAGPPLSVRLFAGRSSAVIDDSNVSAVWASQPVASYSYTYPVVTGTAVFSVDVLAGLRNANLSTSNPYLWMSVELQNPSTWFPAPSRNYVTFSTDPLAHSLAVVPEPSTYAMALAGLACGGYSIWRRRKRA